MPIADPDKRREYERMRYQRDKAKRTAANLAYKRRRRATDPAFAERERARSRLTPAHVKKAHRLLHEALRRGELARPAHCEKCGSPAFVEAAHSDYSQPLDVRWLCRPCHRQWDYDQPKAGA